MLRKKLSSIIVVALTTNLASTPLSVFAETTNSNKIIEDSQKTVEVNKTEVSKFTPYYSQYKEEYDKVFKMDNSNIESITSTGGVLRENVGIENITDGNLDTYWETGRHTSDSFKNELIFTLQEETILNRVAYRSAGNTVGFAENFEIWASDTEEGDNFNLVSSATTSKTADVIEIKFNPTNFKRIKFVFNNKGTATASEMMFYKEDLVLDKMKSIFTDSTLSVVSEEFNTIEKISALEEESKLHPLYEDYKEDFENARNLLQQGNIEASEAIVSKFETYYSDYREAYDDVFKMDNSNIEGITSTGGSLRANVGTENITDGNIDTYWETGRHTSNSFKNELIFTLKEATVLNRIAYRSATNKVGFAEDFEIWASTTTKGDTFQLVTSAEVSKTADMLEIKFNPTNFKRIKFVFKNNGTATISEMMFYKEDKALDKANRLFTDSTMSTVSEEFNTIDKVNELEEELKDHPLYEEYKENFENARNLLQQGNIEASEAKVSKFETYYSDYRQAYDNTFKMDNSNIESITSTGGSLRANVGTENITDGNLDTYWETGRHTSDSFKNELIFTLKEATVLNRIAYRSATNMVGFAEDFEIWASTTTKGDTFQLVTSAKVSKTADMLEIKFNPTSFKRIKFVFKNNGTATISEMMFYEEDSVSDKVNSIFTDNTFSKVVEEFNSMDKINELKVQIENHPLKDQLQEKIELAESIVKGEADFSKNIFTLKQQGDVVGHIRNNLKMASFGTNLQSIGIVAIPGEVFKVYVEAEDGKPLPQIVFTQQEGHYSNWQRVYNLSEGMNTIVVPEIYNENWSKKSNKGGAVYLLNPYTEEQQGKAPTVRIEGGEHFPLFNEGDNVEEFLEELKEYKEKLDANPDTMIDIFEFNAYRLMFTGTASGAYEVYVNEGVDVNESVNVWDEQFELSLKLAGLSDDSEDIRHNSTNVRTAVRLMQPHGAAYAASTHIGVQRFIMEQFLRTDKASVNDIIWGTIHELGHQMEIRAREWGEVTNNMWSNYASILNGKADRINYENLYKVLGPEDGKRTSDEVILEMFWQLQLANENYWPNLERMYRENNPSVPDYQTKKDILAKYSSEVLGMNLTPYFEKYNFTLSDECKAELAKYPEMDKKLWYLNTDAMNYTGHGFADNVKVEITSIVNNAESGITLTFNIDEENKEDLLGYEIIRDGKVIGFTATNSFTDSAVDINENHNYEVVAYARDLSNAKAVEIKSKTPILLVNEKITLKLNEEFNPLEYVNAFDYLGTKIDNISVSHNVDTSNKGTYNVTYEVVANDITASKNITVEVVSDYDYLSDIDWISATTDWSTVKKDLAVSGAKIKLGVNGEEKEFDKGIGTHANSEIVYNLEGTNYEYFETYIGVDRNVTRQNNSSVIFKIYADGEEVYNSGVMKWDDEAKLVRIPLGGVSELKLVADNAGNGITADHASFADAKFLILNAVPRLNIPKSVSTKVGYPIELKEGCSASDAEDGDLTSSIEISGEVNFNKTGKYELTYNVTDSDGNTVTKTRTVAVVDMNDYTYLTEYDWTSTKNSYAAPKKDISTSGKTLRLTGEDGQEVSYERGIGAHSTSTIIYDLSDKDYAYFSSYVGVDREMYGSVGSITFEVWVDGEKQFDSGLMTSKDAQKYVEVDINGAKELKLVVTDGGDNNYSDHATWGDTKLHFANNEGIEINRAELDVLIESVNNLNKETYTEESFNNLQKVLEEVNAELANGYNQEEVDNLFAKLNEAYEKLEEYVDLSEVVNIPDEYLKEAIKSKLNISSDDITIGDMYNLTELNAMGYGIEDLEGLQYAKNLETLNLDYNEISDLSKLKNLRKLSNLQAMYQNIALGNLYKQDNKITVKYDAVNRQGEAINVSSIIVRNNRTLEDVNLNVNECMDENGVISFDTTNLDNAFHTLYLVYESEEDNYLAQAMYMFDNR